MNVIELACPSLGHTESLAIQLAARARPGDCFALSGDLGAGKTSFAKAFIAALLATPQAVTSPTYNIVQWYDSKHAWRILHADLYRLKHAAELAELGLEEAFEADVSVIEWPEIAASLLPVSTLYVGISATDEHARRITLSSAAAYWQEACKGLTL